jgi:uncharacterized protein YeaO (DUF488 family)
MIKIKRIYEPVDEEDGFRILVDNLWPHGISKENAHIDLWLKELAPSNNLRKWFAKEMNQWLEFQKKYLQELKSKKTLIKLIKDIEHKNKNVTIVYSADDEQHNNAVIVRDKLNNYKTINAQVSRIHGA